VKSLSEASRIRLFVGANRTSAIASSSRLIERAGTLNPTRTLLTAVGKFVARPAKLRAGSSTGKRDRSLMKSHNLAFRVTIWLPHQSPRIVVNSASTQAQSRSLRSSFCVHRITTTLILRIKKRILEYWDSPNAGLERQLTSARNSPRHAFSLSAASM